MIEVHNLRKEFTSTKALPGFKGAVKSLFHKEKITKVAVEDISFKVDEGEIIGYLGPNGAGKSTTIKMITGILTPTSGSCRVNGIIPYENRRKNAEQIGVVFGQRTQLWWDLPLTETFGILKKIYNVEENQYKKRFDLLREILGLDEFISSPVRTLSLGQRMRADLAAALIHNPKVLYLDEPTIGLDIVVKDKIRDAIKNFRDEYGTTVMLTTHDMSDIEHLCKRILVIDKGSLIFDGELEKLKKTYGNMRSLKLSFKDDIDTKKGNIKESILSLNQKIYTDFNQKDIVIKHDKRHIETLNLINLVSKHVEVKDIQIEDTPVGEIIKEIYENGI